MLYLELVYCLLLLFCIFVLLQLLFERVYLVVGVLENLETTSLQNQNFGYEHISLSVMCCNYKAICARRSRAMQPHFLHSKSTRDAGKAQGEWTHPVDFCLVSISKRRKVVSVLLVFRVQVINDLCELRDFLAHLHVQVGKQVLIGCC